MNTKTPEEVLNDEFIAITGMNAEHGNLNTLQLRIALISIEKYHAQFQHPVPANGDIGRYKTLYKVMKVVDEWLKSDDTFVTDGENGKKIHNAWIECIKGSLLKRMSKILPPPLDTEVCTSCENKFPTESMKQDSGENYFCKTCYDELQPLMQQEYEQSVTPKPVPDEAGEVKLKDVLLKYEIEFNRIGYTENAVDENSLLQAIDEYCFKISHNKNSEIMRLNKIIGKQQDSFNKLSDELKANYEIAQNPFTKRGIKIALKLFSKWILS